MPDVELPKFSMQGALAFLVTGTTCFLWGTGAPVPQDLILLNSIIIAFFFGNKSGQASTVNAINAANAAPLNAPLIPGDKDE